MDFVFEFSDDELNVNAKDEQKVSKSNNDSDVYPSVDQKDCDNKERRRRRRRNRPPSFSTSFTDYYSYTDEVLGMGAQGVVCTCAHKLTGVEYAVKLINKQLHPNRQRVFKEMDIFHSCRNCKYILKLYEYFEDENYFYLVFEKMFGGQLLHHILKRGHLNEREASLVTKQIAEALAFMHKKGLAHRDLKPENILCQNKDELLPIKLCDFDLASAMRHAGISPMTTPALSTPVGSAEFMAPEVVEVWVSENDGDTLMYDKRCDLWSLGVIIYIMLCGYPPFYGRCSSPNCGWDRGEYCEDCQLLLFQRIQDGEFCFPHPEWDNISCEVKDLISHLLVRDANLRYTAQQALEHPWIKYAPPETALDTPSVLKRENSMRNLNNFTSDALSITKMLENRSVIPPAQRLGMKTESNALSAKNAKLEELATNIRAVLSVAKSSAGPSKCGFEYRLKLLQRNLSTERAVI